MGKDKGAIVKFGGGSMYYKEVQDTGADLTSADTWHEFPYIENSSLSDVTDIEDINDETGNQVASDESNRKVKLTGNFMQTDKDTLDFFKEGCRGKFYAIYQYQGIVNGKYQEILYGICKIRPQVLIESGKKRPPFEISILKNETDLAGTSLPSVKHASSIPITKETYWNMAETSVS